MSFVEMTNEEWEAVYKHHDALIHMAELELQAERIGEICPDASQDQVLKSIENRMHEPDGASAGLSA